MRVRWLAAEYITGLRGKSLLFSSLPVRAALDAGGQAKELLLGGFCNFTALRRRVLQW